MASWVPKRISSLYTLPLKILPVPMTGSVCILIIVSAVIDAAQISADAAIGLAMSLAAFAFFGWYSNRIKFVSYDNLYVSGLFQSVVIPLADVQNLYYSGVAVVVPLKLPSLFGEKIIFVPTWFTSILLVFGSHSVIDGIRAMAKSASHSQSAI
jgi:hypothetical protein